MTATVLTERRDGVRTVTLNRPDRLNAINPTLLADLAAALTEAAADPETRVVILTGAGRAFCAGDDLKEFDDQAGSEAETRAYVDSIQEITRLLVLGDKIVIGAIHGWAVGGGLEWVLNCDFAIFAEDTRCFFPEILLGVFVTGGVTALLPRLVGLPKAKEMILFGDRFDARTAHEIGIAWKVVPEAELRAEADALAQRVAALPAARVRDLKRILNRACAMSVAEAMALETDATVAGFLDPATATRVSAFGR
ncbi:MAG: enoyl-CoA hydratase/isomerase family protein [Alphaproteobacteria bacterium]|nr:enoyl-CoA hydratase/isomerase family protein [Alphaproteobacteria bacterium]